MTGLLREFWAGARLDRGRRRSERGRRERLRISAGTGATSTGGASGTRMARFSRYSSVCVSQHFAQSHACSTEWLFACSPAAWPRWKRKSIPSRSLPKDAEHSRFAHLGNINSSGKTPCSIQQSIERAHAQSNSLFLSITLTLWISAHFLT